jgi:perosamine synthetase
VAAGYKYNLTDIAGALGIEQLKKCSQFARARQEIATAYGDAFSNVPEISCPTCLDDVRHAWHLYIIQLQLERLDINRSEFIANLRTKGVGSSVHFIPLHLHPYYQQTLSYTSDDFPCATVAFDRIVSLPIFSKMSRKDLACVVDAVRRIIEKHRRI